jgi:RND family efflux transporter MFP subunit
MAKAAKILVPVLLLALGALGMKTLIAQRKPAKPDASPAEPPRVRAVAVRFREERLSVRTQGTVQPRTQGALATQVSGRVERVAPAFEKGGFFRAGDVLVRIDPVDYELAVAQAEARVAQAKVQLSREEAEAALARKEWERFGKGEPDALALRQPQLAEARAGVASAEAALKQARLNLERTEIRAPYAGRVWEKMVDVSQWLAAGSPVARVYATDAAEVRLPLPLEDLAFADLPLGEGAPGTEVVLRAAVGGRDLEWKGTVARTEAELDPRTRMIHAVARVADPYAGPTPLLAGLFVDAEIRGRTVRAAALPREALRGEDRVLVVDASDTIRERKVRVLRRERDRVLLAGGLEEGERVCVSALEAAGDGLKVRVRMGGAP